MNSFLKSIFVIIVVALVIGVILSTRSIPHQAPADTQTPTPVVTTPSSLSPFEGMYCYSRDQVATPEAPYKVSEYIEMNIQDGVITGTKSGTQAGPDMTNGFTGTLTGNIKGNDIQLVYDYQVEGSANKEQELYTMSDTILTRHQYQLTQGQGILVPTMNKFVRDITYIKTKCK